MAMSSLAEERHYLEENLQSVECSLRDIHGQIKEQSDQLERLLDSSPQFQLLNEICTSLDKLEEINASSLFWGEDGSGNKAQTLARVQESIEGFQQKIENINNARLRLQQKANEKLDEIDDLSYQLDDVAEKEEAIEEDYLIEREESEKPFRPMLMPWTRDRNDRIRLSKSMAGVAAFLVLLNLLIVFWELPVLSPEEIEIPEYLVEMVKKEKPRPRPPVETLKKKEELRKEQKLAKNEAKPKPTPEEKQAARKKAETAGVLAFKDSFNELLADDVDQRLGAAANLRNKAASAKGDASRSMVMSQATKSSGGINSAELSRGIGGAASGQLGSGVAFSRVESAIGADMVADDRPLSDGIGPSRTDEEIQIVFDRYKAALYRIYNRELRKDPSLKGKMVLRISIEPDGSVSLARVESTDMDSTSLVEGVLDRVKRFNFGPKEGVPPVTILYPIDFLPAA